MNISPKISHTTKDQVRTTFKVKDNPLLSYLKIRRNYLSFGESFGPVFVVAAFHLPLRRVFRRLHLKYTEENISY